MGGWVGILQCLQTGLNGEGGDILHCLWTGLTGKQGILQFLRTGLNGGGGIFYSPPPNTHAHTHIKPKEY